MPEFPQRFLFSIVFLTSFFFLSLSSFAQDYKDYKGELVKPVPCCRQNVLKDGLYIGAGLGYDAYRSRQIIDVNEGGITTVANPTVSGKDFLGNIFAGYGRYFDRFYIAGEIFANYSGVNNGFSINNYNTNFRVSGGYGVSIIPGIALNKLALLYARLGYTRTFFTLEENVTRILSNKTTHWGNGLNTGIGLEVEVWRNLSLRGEYNYINYQGFISQMNTSFSPADNQFILGAVYHFDYI